MGKQTRLARTLEARDSFVRSWNCTRCGGCRAGGWRRCGPAL